MRILAALALILAAASASAAPSTFSVPYGTTWQINYTNVPCPSGVTCNVAIARAPATAAGNCAAASFTQLTGTAPIAGPYVDSTALLGYFCYFAVNVWTISGQTMTSGPSPYLFVTIAPTAPSSIAGK